MLLLPTISLDSGAILQSAHVKVMSIDITTVDSPAANSIDVDVSITVGVYRTATDAAVCKNCVTTRQFYYGGAEKLPEISFNQRDAFIATLNSWLISQHYPGASLL